MTASEPSAASLARRVDKIVAITDPETVEPTATAPVARRPLWIVCDHCGGAGRVMTVNGEGLADKALADARASLPPNGYPLIRAVKNLCDATGLRLRDAKDLIDQALLREGMTQGESDV